MTTLSPQQPQHLRSSIPTFRRWRPSRLMVGLTLGLGVCLCTTSLLAMGAESAPSVASDSLSRAFDDTGITGLIKSRMIGKRDFRGSDIDVRTANGVVTLSGWVSSEEAKAKAQATAHGVAGVKHIDNLLVIGKPPRS